MGTLIFETLCKFLRRFNFFIVERNSFYGCTQASPLGSKFLGSKNWKALPSIVELLGSI